MCSVMQRCIALFFQWCVIDWLCVFIWIDIFTIYIFNILPHVNTKKSSVNKTDRNNVYLSPNDPLLPCSFSIFHTLLMSWCFTGFLYRDHRVSLKCFFQLHPQGISGYMCVLEFNTSTVCSSLWVILVFPFLLRCETKWWHEAQPPGWQEASTSVDHYSLSISSSRPGGTNEGEDLV